MTAAFRMLAPLLVLSLVEACAPAAKTQSDASTGHDAGTSIDAGMPTDSGEDMDASTPTDSGPVDSGVEDSGPGPVDSGPVDSGPGPVDSGPVDAGPVDSGPVDSGPADSGPVDAGPPDSGPVDSGPPMAGQPGAPCTANTDCSDGTSPVCLTAAMEFPNGYCSGTCAQNSDCGSDGVCVSYLLPGDGGPVSGCMRSCVAALDCQAGYICATDFGPQACLPNDCRFAPEVCPADTACDPGDGKCIALPAADAGFPASFDAPPHVITKGGPVLASPEIVAVFFQNDDTSFVTQAEQFYTGIGASTFWTVAEEYGVGPSTATNIIVAQDAPASISDNETCSHGTCTASPMQMWITASIATGLIPATTSNTVYVLNYPSGTTVKSGGPSCQSWDGYHSDFMNGTTDTAYAVIPRCPAYFGQTALQVLTSTAAHELMESSTDPYPGYNPAYVQADTPHLFFDEANGGSEIGDMCQDDYQAYLQLPDFPFVIQRMWSNKSAKAGHDPCVPYYPAELYFNGIPQVTTSVPFDYYQQSGETALGVTIAVGSSGTVPIQIYSDFPTDEPFQVQVLDYASWYNNDPSMALLSITQDKPSGVNGDVITATITVNTAGSQNANGQVTNTELYVVLTCSGSCENPDDPTSYTHEWYGLVAN